MKWELRMKGSDEFVIAADDWHAFLRAIRALTVHCSGRHCSFEAVLLG